MPDFVDAELRGRGIVDIGVAVQAVTDDAWRLYERRDLPRGEVVLYRFGDAIRPRDPSGSAGSEPGPRIASGRALEVGAPHDPEELAVRVGDDQRPHFATCHPRGEILDGGVRADR